MKVFYIALVIVFALDCLGRLLFLGGLAQYPRAVTRSMDAANLLINAAILVWLIALADFFL